MNNLYASLGYYYVKPGLFLFKFFMFKQGITTFKILVIAKNILTSLIVLKYTL